MRFLPRQGGGDPFSHPSGSSVTRPVRVRTGLPCADSRRAHGARPPPGNREPENIQCPAGFIQWRQIVARTVLRQRVQPFVDSRLGRITINSSGLSAAVVGGYRETSRAHSVLLALGVQTPSLVHGRSPQNSHAFPPPKTRCGSSGASPAITCHEALASLQASALVAITGLVFCFLRS